VLQGLTYSKSLFLKIFFYPVPCIVSIHQNRVV